MADNPQYSKALFHQAERIRELKKASRDYHAAKLADSRKSSAKLRFLLFSIRHALSGDSHFDLLVQHLLRPVTDIECVSRFIDTCSHELSSSDDIDECTAWLLAGLFISELSAKNSPYKNILCFTDALHGLYFKGLRNTQKCAAGTYEDYLGQIAPEKRIFALQSLAECLEELMILPLEFNVPGEAPFWILQSIHWLLKGQDANPSFDLHLLGTAACCNSAKLGEEIRQMLLDPEFAFHMCLPLLPSSALDPALLPWLALSLCGYMKHFKNTDELLYAVLDILETLSDPETLETPIESWKANAYIHFFNHVVTFFMSTEETRSMYEALECLLAIESWIQKRVYLYGWETLDEVNLFIRCASCRSQIRMRSSDAELLEKWIFSPSPLSAASAFPALVERECLYAIATSILIKESAKTAIAFEGDLYEQFNRAVFRLLAAESKLPLRLEQIDRLCSLTAIAPSIVQDDMSQAADEVLHLNFSTASMRRNIEDLLDEKKAACPDAGGLSAIRFVLNLLFAFQATASSDAQISLRVLENIASPFVDREKGFPEHILASRVSCSLLNESIFNAAKLNSNASCQKTDITDFPSLSSMAKLISALLEKTENDSIPE